MAAADTSAITAPAAAAPAAAAPVSAPVSAPAAAPAAPASTSPESGVPAVAPQGTADAVAAKPEDGKGPRAGESSIEYLNRVQLEKLKEGEPTPEVTKEGDAAPVVETPAEQKPADEIKPEDKPAEQKPEETKPEDKPAEVAADDEPLTLTPDSPIATSALAKKLDANPEAMAALEKAGISRSELFATARIAAKGAKVLEFFNNDVETAQHAAKEAEMFGGFVKQFTELQNVDDARSLMGEMAKLDYVLDEDGNPIIDDQSKMPVTNGSMGKFLDLAFQIGVDYWAKQGKALGNNDVVAAAETLQALMSARSGGAPEKDYSHLDEQTRARLEEADRRDKEHADRQAADSTRKEQEFEVNVAKGIESKLDDEIKGLLKDTSLSEGQLGWALSQIKEKVTDKLVRSTMFAAKRDALMRRRAGDKTMTARVTHGINSARPLLPGVARSVLEELGVQLSSSKTVADTKLATQVANSRSEVKAAQVAKPQTQVTMADLHKMVRDEFVAANNGREPKTEDFFRLIPAKKRALGIA